MRGLTRSIPPGPRVRQTTSALLDYDPLVIYHAITSTRTATGSYAIPRGPRREPSEFCV